MARKHAARPNRESVPFRVRTADGETVELAYSSPRAAETHDEAAVLESLPWFERATDAQLEVA